MEMKRPVLFVALLLGAALTLHASDSGEVSFDDVAVWLDGMTESYAAMQEEVDEEELAQYYQTMLATATDLWEHPTDLNRATARDLEKIEWLTPFQIKSLLYYREKHGAILSVFEIPYITGFDMETAQWLQYFVTCGPSVRNGPAARNQGEVAATWQQKLTLSKGYALADSVSNRYPGAPFGLAVRAGYRIAPHWELHFGADKDAGETAFTADRRGFDSYNGSVAYKGEGFLQQVVFGQFKVSSGEGLIAGNRFFNGLSGMVTSVRNSRNGLRACSSTGENGFLTGGGFTAGGRNWTWSGWAARTPLDANLSPEDSVHASFTTIYSTGLHRTEAEESRRGAIRERDIGSSLDWRHGGLTLGVTWNDYVFSHPWAQSEQPYKAFSFAGTHGCNFGLHVRFFWNQLLAFGECAQSENGARAVVGGMQWLWPDNASVSLVYRNLAKDYHTRLGSGSGVSSAVANEEGWYLGLNVPLKGRWRVAGCADVAGAPWLKYGTDAPSSRIRCMGRLSCQPSSTSSISLQWSWKSQESNRTGSGVYNRIITIRQQDVKSAVQFNPTSHITSKTQMGWKHYHKEKTESQGFMVSQSISVHPFGNWLELYGQAAWFSTDDYQSALYLSEKDMLYGFSSSMAYHRGWRMAFLCKCTPGRRWTLRCKYGWTGWQDVNTVGSGLDAIDGHIRREMKCQVIKKW